MCLLTRRVEPVDAKHCLAVEHPEVAVVAGEQAGLAGTDHMVANNIPTGKAKKKSEPGEKVGLGGFFQPQLNRALCQAGVWMESRGTGLNKYLKYLGNICWELQNI